MVSSHGREVSSRPCGICAGTWAVPHIHGLEKAVSSKAPTFAGDKKLLEVVRRRANCD